MRENGLPSQQRLVTLRSAVCLPINPYPNQPRTTLVCWHARTQPPRQQRSHLESQSARPKRIRVLLNTWSRRADMEAHGQCGDACFGPKRATHASRKLLVQRDASLDVHAAEGALLQRGSAFGARLWHDTSVRHSTAQPDNRTAVHSNMQATIRLRFTFLPHSMPSTRSHLRRSHALGLFECPP